MSEGDDEPEVAEEERNSSGEAEFHPHDDFPMNEQVSFPVMSTMPILTVSEIGNIGTFTASQ